MTNSLNHNSTTPQSATITRPASGHRQLTTADSTALPALHKSPTTTDSTARQTTSISSMADTAAGSTLPESMASSQIPAFFAFGPIEQNDSIWREVAAATVFGSESILIPGRSPLIRPSHPLTKNAVFQGFVLLLAATYALLLYRNLSDIMMLFKRASHDRRINERLIEDPGRNGFLYFLNLTSAIGILFAGVIAVKYGDVLLSEQISELLSRSAVIALSLLAAVTFLVLILFQMGTLRLAGVITLSKPFVAQLILLKRTCFSLGVIITVPVMLLFALCPQGSGKFWFYVIVIELTLMVLLYLQKTLSLFISKKVSVLHWILYLCIVEIFPLSFLWFLVVR